MSAETKKIAMAFLVNRFGSQAMALSHCRPYEKKGMSTDESIVHAALVRAIDLASMKFSEIQKGDKEDADQAQEYRE